MGSKRPHPALVLFLLSPLLGELVSGYQAPLEFLHPLNLAVTLVPYGCGALAIRELLVRRRRGWISLVLLGLAFGMIFEGLVTRVIFNPSWQDLGPLAGYGRACGVNWILALGVVHFQAAVSVISAILLAEMLYPERRGEAWIGIPVMIACCLAVPGWALVLGLFVAYVPPLSGIAALLVLAVVLIAPAVFVPVRPLLTCDLPCRKRRRHGLASKHPPSPLSFGKERGLGGEFTSSPYLLPDAIDQAADGDRSPRPLVFGLTGGIGMALIMAGTYILPEWAGRPPAGMMFAILVIVMSVEFIFLTMLNKAGAAWNDQHRLALVAGFLAFFLVFGIAEDFTAFAGRSLVSITAIVLLRRLWTAVGRRIPPHDVTEA